MKNFPSALIHGIISKEDFLTDEIILVNKRGKHHG